MQRVVRLFYPVAFYFFFVIFITPPPPCSLSLSLSLPPQQHSQARTLLATNEFTRLRRRLPRPRTVEMKGAEGKQCQLHLVFSLSALKSLIIYITKCALSMCADSLDPLLLPLMDEAVRREVRAL